MIQHMATAIEWPANGICTSVSVTFAAPITTEPGRALVGASSAGRYNHPASSTIVPRETKGLDYCCSIVPHFSVF